MTVVDLAAESILGVVHPSEGAAAPSGVTVDDDGVLWATDGSTATVSVRSEPVALGRGRVGPIPLALDPEDRHWLRILATGRIGPTELAVTPTFTPRHWVAGAARDGAAEAHDKRVEVPPRTDGVVLDIELRRAPTADGPNPFLERLELRIDEPGLIELLPAVYRSEGRPQAFLDPFLRLAQSSVDEIIDRLTDLPTQFDPMTAKDADDERWLDWLAGWVDARLDETWTTDTRRAAVGTAFARHAVAGTAAALVEEIKAELGIDRVDIVEPGDVASVWVLGDSGSELGTSTMTAAAPAVGSVTGVTAAVDGSHLIGPGDYGAPLFGDLAHCFVVRVHQADVARPEQRQRLEALIEREKPVLTRAHVCAVEPGISLGLQGSIGVDTVIGPPRRAGAVDGLPRLGRSANTTGLPDTGGRHPATTVIP